MSTLTSRKLAGAVTAIIANVVVVLVPAYLEVEVDLSVHLAAIASITGLGGYQVFAQKTIDGLDEIEV